MSYDTVYFAHFFYVAISFECLQGNLLDFIVLTIAEGIPLHILMRLAAPNIHITYVQAIIGIINKLSAIDLERSVQNIFFLFLTSIPSLFLKCVCIYSEIENTSHYGLCFNNVRL